MNIQNSKHTSSSSSITAHPPKERDPVLDVGISSLGAAMRSFYAYEPWTKLPGGTVNLEFGWYDGWKDGRCCVPQVLEESTVVFTCFYGFCLLFAWIFLQNTAMACHLQDAEKGWMNFGHNMRSQPCYMDLHGFVWKPDRICQFYGQSKPQKRLRYPVFRQTHSPKSSCPLKLIIWPPLRYQLLVPDGSNEPVCKGIFGMLMLDTETMSTLVEMHDRLGSRCQIIYYGRGLFCPQNSGMFFRQLRI